MILRPRLLDRLNTDSAVTVVSAPTGFGKTVLLAQWVRTLGASYRVLWMHPDRELASAAFWDELAALIAEAGIPVGDRTLPTHRRVARALRHPPEPTILVLDSVDRYADPELVRHLYEMAQTSSQLRMVASMQSSLQWPAGTSDDSQLLGAAELALTPEEVAMLLIERGVSDGALDDESTYGWTKGWPALSSSVIRSVTDSPAADMTITARNAIRSYLHEHVIGKLQRDGLFELAMFSSVPEWIGPDIADLLEPYGDSDDPLDTLARTGLLFAERYAGQTVYRWPAPVRTTLQHQLTELRPEVALSLHSSIARRLVEIGHFDLAIDHAIQSLDHGLMVQIIENCWGRLLNTDRYALDRAFAALPESAIRASGTACAVRDIRSNLFRDGSPTDHLTPLADPFPADRESLLALAHSKQARTSVETANAMMIALRCRGQFDRAASWASSADLLARAAGLARPTEVVGRVPTVLLQVGITRLVCGDLTGATETLRRVFESSTVGVASYVHRDAAAKMSLVLALRGQTAASADWLRRHDDRVVSDGRLATYVNLTAALTRALNAIDRLDRAGWESEVDVLEPLAVWEKSWNPYFSLVHARAGLLWGDRYGALERLKSERARQGPWEGANTTVAPLLDAVQAELLISLGRANQASNLLRARPPHSARQAVLARLALLTAPPDVALRTATALGDTAGTPRAHVQILLVAAAAQGALGDRESAVDHLHNAVQILRFTGLRYPLESVPREQFGDIAGLVAGAQKMFDSVPKFAAPLAPPDLTMVTLSEREQLILARVVRGQNMKQMATELTVSYNTVKTQMRSLYSKLDARSRQQAVANAMERGLLPLRSHSKNRDGEGRGNH